METLLLAAYPKSGSTLLNEVFYECSWVLDPEWCPVEGRPDLNSEVYGIYRLNSMGLRPSPSPFLNGRYQVKTHEKYSDKLLKKNKFFAPVYKIIVISRNPFDILLSSINFLRGRAISKRIKNPQYSQMDTQIALDVSKILPTYECNANLNKFIDDFTLDNLCKEGYLVNVCRRFKESSALIDQFAGMSGSWLDFAKSFDNCEVPVLKIKFEDLVGVNGNAREKCISSIGKFLECDVNILRESLSRQASNTLKRKQSGHPYFPRAASGYWKDYLPMDECIAFFNQYKAEMAEIGYQDILK